MTRVIKKLFQLIGLEIRRIKPQGVKKSTERTPASMQAGLMRCAKHGINPKTIIDVGAAQGSWSVKANSIWPNADFILFEPLAERKVELGELSTRHNNFHVVSSAVGKEKSKLQFHVTEDLDGSGFEVPKIPGQNIREVDVTTLDDEIDKLGFQGPYLVKLDTHGFETPILEGCRSILPRIELFIVECYGFHIAEKSLLMWEMCQYMDGLGFRVFDLVDVMLRPRDGVFWQCDIFFVPKNNSVFQSNTYS